MRDTKGAEALLSLFTSPDHASAIVGDLIETYGDRSSGPFWVDIVRILFALQRRAVVDAPIRVLSLAALGLVLLVGPAVVGFAAVALFPASINSPASWLAMSLIWLLGALRIGGSLVEMAPRRGMAACATLAVIIEMVLVALAIAAPRADSARGLVMHSYATGFLAPVALLLGGAIARRRRIAEHLDEMEALS